MSARFLTTLTLVLATVGVAGCGSEEQGSPIPADQAAALQDQLDGIQRRLDNGSVGACNDILAGAKGPNLDAVNQLIESLPDGVDPDVRDALQQSFDRLFDLVDERCAELADAQPDPAPAPEPQTTPEHTTPDETDTTDTTPAEQPPEEPPPTDAPPLDPGAPDQPPPDPVPPDGGGGDGTLPPGNE